MSSEEDEDDVYDVERILAEKDDDLGEHVYLVKWDGYPDEECTWEPAEHFTDPDALRQWAAQKARDDTLDAYDVQRIQDQMDAFSARQDKEADSEVDGDGKGSQASSTDLDEVQERPRKRLKLVTDAPLLTKKGLARPARASSSQRRSVSPANKQQHQSTTRPKPTASPMHRPTDKAPAIPKPAVRPLHAPPATSLPSRKTSSSTTTSHPNMSKAFAEPLAEAPLRKPFLQPSQSEPPQHFYAPATHSRARSDKPVIRNNTGKRFNNYQHLNNVRKKMNEDRAPPPPQKETPVANPPDELASDSTERTGPPHASWLFFDDDDDVQSRQDGIEQAAESLFTLSNQQQNTTQGRVRAAASSGEQANASGITLQNASGLEQNAEVENVQDNNSLVSPFTSRDVVAHLADADEPIQTSNITPTAIPPQIDISASKDAETRPRPRRNSLFNRGLPLSATTDQRRDDPPRPRSPPGEPQKILLPPTGNRRPPASEGLSGMSTPAAQNFTSHGEIVRAYNGREWQKGDVVLDLYLDHRAAGGSKLLHVPWEYAGPIINLKQGRQLPIGFSPTVTRPQYELLAKDRWFSYFAIGAIEPFPDTADGVASLADHLEEWDLAGLWEHPNKDLMLILYSCRSPSWQSLGQKPIRLGEPRLHIAFRRKFHEPGPLVETLARIVERGKRIEEEEEARGSEAQIRAQTIEQRDTSRRRGRSPSRSRTETVDPRREARRARSVSRPRLHTAEERDEHYDTNRGRTSERRSTASVPTVRSVAPPTDTLQSPGVQLLCELQMTMSPQYDGTMSEDTMNVSPQSPRNSGAELSRPNTALTGIVAPPIVDTRDTTTAAADTLFAGLDRTLKDLSWSPDLPKVAKGNVFVILVHKLTKVDRIQQLKSWLSKEGLPSSHIFDKLISGHWADFCRHIENSVCVVLFDKHYPVINLDSLAKWLERENLLCWEVDYLAVADTPLQTTRLFPRGTAMAISEGCFVHEPSATLSVLKWFKAKVSKPYPSSKLVIPPSINLVLQEQAILARKETNKNQFLDIAKLLHEMKELNNSETDASDSGLGEGSNLEFSVLRPEWSEVYKDIPQSGEKLSAIETKERDIEKDDKLLQYFGAWAARHLEDHRRFIAFTINDEMGKKPKHIEHVRLQLIKGFADNKLGKPKASSSRAKGKDRARSKDRVRSASAMSTPRT